LEQDTAEPHTFAVQYPGSLLALSKGLAEVTGLDIETLRETPWTELVHPGDLSLIQRWGEQLHLGRQVTPARARFRMGDGSYRFFELAATADPEGELLVGTARALDATEPRPQHRKLRAGGIELDERARLITAAGRALTVTCRADPHF
jgi:PAS domain S-box-containing protein